MQNWRFTYYEMWPIAFVQLSTSPYQLCTSPLHAAKHYSRPSKKDLGALETQTMLPADQYNLNRDDVHIKQRQGIMIGNVQRNWGNPGQLELVCYPTSWPWS